MMKETLYLFTIEYPYGTGETFVENELEHHLKKFKNVVLFPLIKKGEARKVDERVTIVNLFENESYRPFKILLRYFFSVVTILLSEFFNTPSKKAFIKRLPFLRSSLLQNHYRAEQLQRKLGKEELKNGVLYSFWTDDWATVLSILKRKKKINGFISRVHGYDLYQERWPEGIIPFRALQLRNVMKIAAVSRDGLMYLQEQYPQYKNKFFLNHLGVQDRGTAAFAEASALTMVSCSNLVALKRVHLIAELLAKVNVPVRWIHFGAGAEMEKLQSLVKKLPSDISVELRGNVANAELINYYQSNTVHFFIHLSETEGGVPIALQEAASFGIPLIGTNAGGIPEIVTENTGLLIPVAFDMNMLAQFVNNFTAGEMNTSAFRKKVKDFWKQNFNAGVNYEYFYRELMQNKTNTNG